MKKFFCLLGCLLSIVSTSSYGQKDKLTVKNGLYVDFVIVPVNWYITKFSIFALDTLDLNSINYSSVDDFVSSVCTQADCFGNTFATYKAYRDLFGSNAETYTSATFSENDAANRMKKFKCCDTIRGFKTHEIIYVEYCKIGGIFLEGDYADYKESYYTDLMYPFHDFKKIYIPITIVDFSEPPLLNFKP